MRSAAIFRYLHNIGCLFCRTRHVFLGMEPVYVGNNQVPTERVAIFDESQRAWTQQEISSFMARKKGVREFPWSEPEFLIGTMDRRSDWATIVCLVGGGQEINKGEAGLSEWFDSLKRSYPQIGRASCRERV